VPSSSGPSQCNFNKVPGPEYGSTTIFQNVVKHSADSTVSKRMEHSTTGNILVILNCDKQPCRKLSHNIQRNDHAVHIFYLQRDECKPCQSKSKMTYVIFPRIQRQKESKVTKQLTEY